MAIRLWWPRLPGILMNENDKGPWGGAPTGGSDGNGGGNGDGAGPRNPWAVPPQGPKPRSAPTGNPFEDLIRRSRGGGNGGGWGGGPGGGIAGPNGRNLWLIGAGALLLLWIAFTSVHPITPQERGVVTYLGRYSGTLGPGIQMTAPAPFASVRVINVDEIRTEDFPGEGSGPNLMLTGDQNIVDLSYRVRWSISNPEAYIFQIRDPDKTVRDVAESAMRSVVATATLNQAIGEGRGAIEARVSTLMQRILDEYASGIRVEGVSVTNASAPAAVDEDFKQVTAAQQRAQAALNDARAYAQQVISRAQGEAAQFDRIYEQYRTAPDVTRRRLYYETMERVLGNANTTVIEAPNGVMTYLPLPQGATAPAPAPSPAPQSGQRSGGNQ